MKISELISSLEQIKIRLNETYQLDDDQARILGKTTKITEEVGELANEVLLSLSLQRQNKLTNFDESNLGKELADVVFTTLLLGLELEIDVEQALKDRLQDINHRQDL